MMPPTMGAHGGPGQMGFGPNKMHPNMMGAGGAPPMGQFPQPNSQYPNQLPQGECTWAFHIKENWKRSIFEK